MTKMGEAPCGKCSYYMRVKLTGKKRAAEDGGTYWQCRPAQFCENCGEPMKWLHQPPSDELLLNFADAISSAIEL